MFTLPSIRPVHATAKSAPLQAARDLLTVQGAYIWGATYESPKPSILGQDCTGRERVRRSPASSRPAVISAPRFQRLALSAMEVTGCAAMNVNSYVDRGVDVRRYHTFNWGPADTFSTGDPRLDNNRFFDERVRAQVEKVLSGKGFEKTTSGTPDLLVHYHASVTQEIDVRNLDREYAYCDHADCRPYVHDAGTLFVDLIDPRTNTLIWRGWAEGSVDGVIDNQEWMEARIDEAVRLILERLPRRL